MIDRYLLSPDLLHVSLLQYGKRRVPRYIRRLIVKREKAQALDGPLASYVWQHRFTILHGLHPSYTLTVVLAISDGGERGGAEVVRGTFTPIQ